MAKVIVVQVVYNNRRFIEPVFKSVFAQSFKDFKFVAVIAGNEDKSKELILEKFPDVEVIDPGYNIGFSKGHNFVFSRYPEAGFFQLVNPDLILSPNYIQEMLKAFTDPKVGAATGKLYKISNIQYPIPNESKTKVIDTTGVNIFKSGRARDRGQHELDSGQYDSLLNVQAVSAAGAMYRASALNTIGYALDEKRYEYFDEDFHSYWEDVDLAWRMANRGWKNVYVPSAVGYHGRVAGSSPGGYKKFFSFVRFHRAIPQRIRELNYKNHILMYVKNSPWFYPQFFVREFFMLAYILVFETGTLKVLPEIINNFSKMWSKRRFYAK